MATRRAKQRAGHRPGPAPHGSRASWDELYYRMAGLMGSRSRDDSPVGAVIVDSDHVVLAMGYNGLPRRVADLEERLGDGEKLRWTVHAEENAVCNAALVGTSLRGGTIYVTKFPCSRCAGVIVQVGITRLVCLGKRFWSKDPSGDDGTRSLRILLEAGVAVHAPRIKIMEKRRPATSPARRQERPPNGRKVHDRAGPLPKISPARNGLAKSTTNHA